MYAGYDAVQGFQLYCSDPSGNYAAWKAHATGKNSVNAISQLKDEFQEGLSLKEGLILAAKVLGKSMDMNKPDANKFEIGVVAKDATNALTGICQRRVEGQELQKILEEAKVFEDAAQSKK